MASTRDAAAAVAVANLRRLYHFLEWQARDAGHWIAGGYLICAFNDKWQRRNGVDILAPLTEDKLRGLARERSVEILRAQEKIKILSRSGVYRCRVCRKLFSNHTMSLVHALDEHDDFPAVKAAGKE
jgi:hypothetical protein